MRSIETIDEAIIAIRNTLIAQSQLSSDRVLNALSAQGTELDKLLEDSVYTSINENDTTLLFELTTLDSTSDISMEEGDKYTAKDLACDNSVKCGTSPCGDFIIDRSLTYYKSYRLKLILYGSCSSSLAIKLAGRMRSSNVRADLYSSGVYVADVSNPQSLNEFKNDMMWLRNDINIDIGVKYSIPQVSEIEEFKNLNTIKIIGRD